MRKAFWIILAVLIVAIGVPTASADSYTATFTCEGVCPGGIPTAPDVSFPDPVLSVTWSGELFTLTLPPIDLPSDFYEWNAVANANPGVSGFSSDFNIFDNSSLAVSTDTLPFPEPEGAFNFAAGGLTFEAASTPEPCSVALMLVGIGGLLVRRKRTGQGRQPAA
jgi:hypothetical protein